MTALQTAWIMLMTGIAFEVAGTTCMRYFVVSSPALSQISATIGIVLSYFFASRAMETIPVGITYAVWSGVGLGGISLLSWHFFAEPMPFIKLAGIGLVIAGMIVINTAKKTA